MTSRILIVDDQELFASGLGMVLDAQPDLEAAGYAADGETALETARELRPDVILLDLRMPGMPGLEVLETWVDSADACPVIVLTTLRNERAALEAMRLGASAFVTKDAPPALLLDVVRRVLAGEDAVGAPELDELLDRHGARAPLVEPVLPELSPREREVYLLCARGLSNAEIATTTYLSEATVKTHVRAVLQKLDLRSRVQIAIHAYEHGIVRRRL